MQETGATTPVSDPKHRLNKKKYALISFAVFCILVAGYLVYRVNVAPVKTTNATVDRVSVRQLPNSYQYEKLDTYELGISGTTAKISFKKPNEFKKFSDVKEEKTSSSANLVHSNSKGHSIAFMTATLFNSTLAQDKTFLTSLNANLKSGEGTGYDTVTEPVKKFANDATAQGYKITLSKAKSYANANIKSNAWQFDVSATDDLQKLAPLKGKVVMAIKGQTTYYWGIFSLDYNWQPNTKVWDQSINSLKIQ